MFHSSRARRLGSAALVVSTMSMGLAACGSSSKSAASPTTSAAAAPTTSAAASTTTAAVQTSAAVAPTSGAAAPTSGAVAPSTSAAVAPSGSAAAPAGNFKKGLKVYFIPKDTQNPYEVIADNGGKAALAELGGTVTVSSGTADTAAAQIPSIQKIASSRSPRRREAKRPTKEDRTRGYSRDAWANRIRLT